MIYDLVPYNDVILKTKLEKFDFSNPPTDPIQLAHDLAESVIHHNGLGLAANQIGLPFRVFAIKASPVIVCFNPIIVNTSEEQIYLDEGCLTYSNLFVKIKRPRRIKIRYTEPNSNVVTREFDDLSARIVLHEIDHLDGINFTQRANRFHLDQAKKKTKCV